MRTLHIPRYTVSDYRLWEGDWELIDGIPYAMSPSPVRRHQFIASKLFRHIADAVESGHTACSECQVLYELDWIINENTVVKPDIVIACESDKGGDFITTPPVLIIEILSPSTSLKDRHTKYEIYLEQGVKYYILIDPASKTYHSYVLSGDHYSEEDITRFALHDRCAIALDLAQVMAEV